MFDQIQTAMHCQWAEMAMLASATQYIDWSEIIVHQRYFCIKDLRFSAVHRIILQTRYQSTR